MNRFRSLPLQAKISLIYIFTNLLVFVINIILLMGINSMSGEMDMVYQGNLHLNELSVALEDVQDSMTDYLNAKTSDSLEEYYRSEQDYREMVQELNEDVTGVSFSRMERNIRYMSENYLELVGQTVEAKRGRNVEKYRVRYENATQMYQYISDYIESLNLIDENTKYLIIDTNLPEELITYICNKYSDKYIIADGISSKKVVRLKPVLDKLSLLKVNVYEGETLTKESKPELIIKSLIKQGLKTCIVTSGSNPTVYNVGKEIKMEPTLKIKKEEIVNTTGAGDSMLSGTVLGLTLGYDMTNAVKIGHIFANANLKVNTPTLKERTLN